MAFSTLSPNDPAGGFLRKAGAFFKELYDRVLAAVNRQAGRIPREKRRFVLIASGAAIGLLLLVITWVSLRSKGGEAAGWEPSYTADRPRIRHPIPQDELFLPEEPDFVPGVLLEREQRAEWTLEDASPWWQDPLRSGEKEWRDQIEMTIDDIMESVP